LRGIPDPLRRLEASVSELCRIHEAMFGYAWHAAHVRKASPTLDAEMSAYEDLAHGIAGIIVATDSPMPRCAGLLDFLTYGHCGCRGASPRADPGDPDRDSSPSPYREASNSPSQSLEKGPGP